MNQCVNVVATRGGWRAALYFSVSSLYYYSVVYESRATSEVEFVTGKAHNTRSHTSPLAFEFDQLSPSVNPQLPLAGTLDSRLTRAIML